MADFTAYNEKELFFRIAEGDERAFEALFRRYYPLLSRVVAVYSLSEADKEDILNETFIRIWLSRDKLMELERPESWFCRIASRECLRMIARNGRRQQQENAYRAQAPAYAKHTPEQKMLEIDLSRLVAQAIDLLPAQRKRIYQLSRTQGLKPAAIAGQLGISVNTVKNSLVSALKDIRAYLAASGIEVPFLIIMPLLDKLFSSLIV